MAIHLKRSVNTYVSLLAVLKIHAAFVPLEAEFPKDRKHFIMKDSGVKAVITTSDLCKSVRKNGIKTIVLDELEAEIAKLNPEALDEKRLPPSKDNLCYVIYTSGTTGRPKGVAVEHPSICNFVRVAQQVYQMRNDDRVYQGMTIAFDFSIEEIWVPLTVGAAIVPGPTDCRRIGPELGDFLTKNKITVFCCVPTLLATIEKDIPSLRLLIVGGEVCTPELVRRWSRPGLRILNTYGPTETTVTATWSELKPGKKVTIGRPLPSYKVEIMDENLNPLPKGQTGEICIGGIGVARGYLNRPELTAEKFVPDPLATNSNPRRRLYRTGDLGRINRDGEIEYLGRMDTQVKIRGYRIETSEIESVMLSLPEIERAVVSVWQPSKGTSELAAWYTMKPGIKKDEKQVTDALFETLKKKLPGYMIPAYVQHIDEIPVLPSGKVDKKRLPSPCGKRLRHSDKDFVPPSNEMEKLLADAFAKALGMEEVSAADDFFEDLGGHSLAAAKLVSILRKQSAFSSIGLADVYAYPTVQALSKKLASLETEQERLQVGQERTSGSKRCIYTYPSWRVWLCGIGQATALLLYIALLSIPGLMIFKKALFIAEHDPSAIGAVAGLVAIGLEASFVTALLMPIVMKWLIVGRLKPGRYPLWGLFFLRWWIVERANQLAPLAFISGTSLFNLYARAMGARVGNGCIFRTHLFHSMDLIEIGNGTCIDDSSHLYAYSIADGFLTLKAINIGRNCFVGSNSVIMPGSRMEDGALLGDQSLLPEDSLIPKEQAWAGSPARPQEELKKDMSGLLEIPTASIGSAKKTVVALCFLGAVVITMAVPFIATVPGFVIIDLFYEKLGNGWDLLGTPLAGLLFVISICAMAVAGKWLVLPRIHSGVYPVDSIFYVRKWFVDRLIRMSLEFCDSLYATLYLPPFLRLLGARIGKWAEISTIAHITPDLLEIDRESFIADAAHVGPACVFRGHIRIRPTKIGKRTFVGNSAFVPEGTILPDECLIGVLSIPPKGKIEPGTTWLGSPAIYLPRRQESQQFPESQTFRPTRRRYVQRLFYEYFRVTLPATLYFLAISAVAPSIVWLLENMSIHTAALGTAALFVLAGIGNTLIVASIKWLLIGTYTPLVRPLWSTFVRRTELVTGLYENVVVPSLLLPLTGTPFASWVMRLLGARVGKRCYIETTFMTEFDLVTIGDDCNVGFASSLQTHLFEDRVMKMSRLTIGNGCSVGPRAVILYDSILEDRVRLDSLSLVMKGESLPADTFWCGAPAQKRTAPTTSIRAVKIQHSHDSTVTKKRGEDKNVIPDLKAA